VPKPTRRSRTLRFKKPKTRLQEVRQKCGIKRASAAETLDIREDYLKRIEKGKAHPSFALLVRMGEIYDCDPSTLLKRLGAKIDWSQREQREQQVSGRRSEPLCEGRFAPVHARMCLSIGGLSTDCSLIDDSFLPKKSRDLSRIEILKIHGAIDE